MRVSGGDATVSEPTAEVINRPQISEDGSHVYFFARGVLTTNPNRYGQSAQPGANNLYLFERDAQYPSGHTVFIANLSADPAEELWTGTGPGGANLTPDGRYFVFTSKTDLTPDDTSVNQQVFEYDAETGALVRVSVGQDGFDDDGNGGVGSAEIVRPEYEFHYMAAAYASARSVSADGSYVFFQSPIGLTGEAFNDKLIEGGVYANNVYEYHDGTVSLISDGRDLTRVGVEGRLGLIGTDESGADVFFTSADQLAPGAGDDDANTFDARIDGGFPPPQPAPSCSEEACQGSLSAAPTLLSPGSEFQAGGNPPLATSNPVTTKPKPKTTKKKKRKKQKKTSKKVKGKGSKAQLNRGAGR